MGETCTAVFLCVKGCRETELLTNSEISLYHLNHGTIKKKRV